MSGAAENALPHLDEARERFQQLESVSMANTALGEKADCLRDLGRYEESAAAYQETIKMDEKHLDLRGSAVGKGQLATVRMLQKNYSEALNLYNEVREIFEQMGEPGSVATAWHQIGRVHEEAGQYEAAEKAYQESLKIEVQIGNGYGEITTLGQFGSLYSRMGRVEDAVAFYRQAADVTQAFGDFNSEGAVRSNLANELIKLQRYDEARIELHRAIECDRPFGYVAEPWLAFQILSDLERAVGNQSAAKQARSQAIQAYLAYRRAGGESQVPGGELCALVAQQPEAAKAELPELMQDPDLQTYLKVLIPHLQAVLAGSRDVTLADDPNLDYDDAAELLLLIESLSANK
jgi:hypothetical protein